MGKVMLKAIERTKQPGRFKENGFVAGVIYGDTITGAASVKFEEAELKKVLTQHGYNAKVWIDYKSSKTFGFVKEVQKDAISGVITHIDVQMVSKDHEIKLQIPVIFKGEDELKAKQLQLQIYRDEVNVLGKMDLMVDALSIDVSEMSLGDTITIGNFKLSKKLKVSEKEDTVYGVIIELRELADEAVVDDAAEQEPQV